MLNRLRSRLTHLPRDTRDTLFLLVVIAWVVLPQVGNLPLWCSALTAGVLLWRGWLAVGQRPLPSRWWLAGLLIVTLAATAATHRTLLGRDAGVTLIVVLLALKTLELRARRDALVVFFLGFFAMLTNFFYSQSLLVAAAMLVALLGLLTALVNAHRPVGHPSLAESAWMAARMALLGAPVMVALFVLFPRFAPLWGIPNDAMTGRSGLSNTMEVGSIAKLVLDEGVAFRVKFDGAPPPQGAMYFRGPVLARFDGREWRPLAEPEFMIFDAERRSGVERSGPVIDYEVTQEPSSRPWLFMLETPSESPRMPPDQRAIMTADLQWLAGRPITDIVRFRARSQLDYRYGLGAARTGGLQPYLALPRDFNPRTLALAEQLRAAAPAGDGRALVRAALQRLRTGGYAYTLEPGVYGTHSADEFWFDRKEGFCEHIASAFVILMRAAGVPARVVTGYQGGELNAIDGFWTVRQADAHAWTEVWLDDQGWTRVDPTGAVSPGRIGQFQRLRAPDGVFTGAIATLSPTALAQLRAVWEAANNRWNQWVLNYTQSRQLDLLKNLGFESPSWEDLGKVLAGLVTLVALGGVAWSMWERTQHDPWLRLLARTRRRLERAGVAVPGAQPSPRGLAQAVAASGWPQELTARWRTALLALEAQRYAPGDSATAARRLATLRRELARLTVPSGA